MKRFPHCPYPSEKLGAPPVSPASATTGSEGDSSAVFSATGSAGVWNATTCDVAASSCSRSISLRNSSSFAAAATAAFLLNRLYYAAFAPDTGTPFMDSKYLL